MVLKQKDETSGNLNAKLTKLGYKRMDIYIHQVLEDAELIHDMMKGASKTRKAELEAMRKTLLGISNNCRNGSVPLLWYCTEGLAKSYPCEFSNFADDGIDCTNYIKRPENCTIMRVNYDDLDNIIAFEMMCKDLGFTHRRMEELLKDVGIITETPADVLLNIIGDSEPYKYSKMYRIGRSGYWDDDRGVMYDYFQNVAFKDKYYRIPVEYSCRKALSSVLDRLLDVLKTEKIPFSLCSLDDKSITFMIGIERVNDFTKAVKEPVTIRAFGRLFKTVAKVEEIEGMEDLS